MEKQEQVKNVWKPLCFIFATLLALSWVFFGFLYGSGGVDFSALESSEQVHTDNGSPVTDENGKELPSDETIPMPKAMSFSSAAALDGTEAVYDSIMLTATIKPDTATVKTVDWSIAFVNPSSEWATGKTVTDYVTVTPTGDGATTATVQCLQPFGSQIKVVVTSRLNKDAKAECMVDFAQRVQSFALDFYEGSGNYLSMNSVDYPSNNYVESYTHISTSYPRLDADRLECYFSFKYYPYTVEDSFVLSTKFGFAENVTAGSSTWREKFEKMGVLSSGDVVAPVISSVDFSGEDRFLVVYEPSGFFSLNQKQSWYAEFMELVGLQASSNAPQQFHYFSTTITMAGEHSTFSYVFFHGLTDKSFGSDYISLEIDPPSVVI